MKKILHPFDRQFYFMNGPRWFPVYIVIDTERGYLSFTGVQAPLSSGDAKGGCGQIDMEYDHRNKLQNDSRYSNPITVDELRFAKGWNAAMWYEILSLWHKYHLKKVGAVPSTIMGWLNNLPDTDRTPAWC